jgi:hypothetical protein
VVVSSSVDAVKSNCVSKDLLQCQKWVFCSDTYIPKLVSIDNISFKDCETGNRPRTGLNRKDQSTKNLYTLKRVLSKHLNAFACGIPIMTGDLPCEYPPEQMRCVRSEER